MGIQLTEDQSKKLETILWLTDPLGGRGSGRTQVLAIAYIQHSIKYKTWIYIVNHGMAHPMADKELSDRILGIVGGMVGYSVKIRRQGGTPAILVEPSEREPFGGNNPYQHRGKDSNG